MAENQAPVPTAASYSEEVLQAHAELWNLTFGYLKSMALECAIKLGIPNAIHRLGGAATLPDLLAALPIPERKKPYFPRLMRYLAASGILAVDVSKAEAGDECANGGEAAATYLLTPLSRLLVADDGTRADLSPFVLSQTNRYHVGAALYLPEWFASDAAAEMPFKTAHGADPWTVFARDKKMNGVFNAGMAADTRFAMDFVVGNCGDAFDGVGSLVDVAGGTGTAARAIAGAFPRIKCSVLDLPNVIDSVQADDGVVEYVAGDMMSSIPKADAVFLKYVMHDWDDENCVKILKQCRKAIPESGGKVIIVDMVVGSTKAASHYEAQVVFDLLMMVITAGKERDEGEWRKIFLDAGFSRWETRPVLGSMALIQLYL